MQTVIVAALVAIMVVRGPAVADTGDLDPTLDGGVLVTTFTDNPIGWGGLVQQADGKLVVGGSGFTLVRYMPNGFLDPSFDGDGVVTTPLGASVLGLALQPDGKLLAVGGSGQIVVARYLTDGSLDTTFDGDGVVTTSIGMQAEGAAIALQADGRIVVAGRSGSTSMPELTVVRYETDGSLDTSFDVDGIATTPVSVSAIGFAVAVQPDGRIVAAGRAVTPVHPGGEFALARFETDGSLDPTFDGDGVVTTSIGFGDAALAVALQADGKIVAAGGYLSGAVLQAALARYETDGSLDPTFGGNGTVLVPGGFGSLASAVALQPDGAILIAGSRSDADFRRSVMLARYDATGILDETFFCGGGTVVTPIGTLSAGANDLILQADGKPVVAGGGVAPDGVTFSEVLLRFGGTPVTFDRALAPTKLIVVDKLASSSSAKAVYVARAPQVWKGAGTNVDKLRARLDLAYGSPSASGSFSVGCGEAGGTGWLKNDEYAAKYVNRLAPSGASQARVIVLKSGIVARFVGKGLGEVPFDILAAGPPAGSVFANLDVTNDTERNRHCSEFPACTWSSIAGGTGAKLVCRGGLPDFACQASP